MSWFNPYGILFSQRVSLWCDLIPASIRSHRLQIQSFCFFRLAISPHAQRPVVALTTGSFALPGMV